MFLHLARISLFPIVFSCLCWGAGAATGPFAASQGSYNGAQLDGKPALITLTVNASGNFSGSLRLQESRVSLTGKFVDHQAQTSVRLATAGTVPVQVTLSDTTPEVSVEIDPANASGLQQTLTARRGYFNAKTQPATQFAGKYTLIIPGSDADASLPRGDGYASVTVTLAGAVRAAGKLADGTTFTSSSSVFAEGQWPFFAFSASGKATAGGWLAFADLDNSDVGGELTWTKQALAKAAMYPNGFVDYHPMVYGSRYRSPVARGEKILNLEDFVLSLEGGSLPARLESLAALSSDNKVENKSANNLKVSLQPQTGLFSGSVIPEGAKTRLTFQGVALQRQNLGAGFFASERKSGAISIAAPQPLLNAPEIRGPTNLVIGQEGGFSAVIGATVTNYFWDFGDGTTISNEPAVAHLWLAAGEYGVTLRVFDGFHEEGVASTALVHVAVETPHYVALASTNPVPPYLSWETAATNIQDAINAAISSPVVVSNGVYETGAILVQRVLNVRIAVSRAITVASVNGPEFTVIKGIPDSALNPLGYGAVRCAYLTNGCLLTGFTLTNGATEPNGVGGAAWCEDATSVISNSVLSGNFAYDAGALHSGTAIDCRFTGNQAANNGGGAESAILLRCVLNENRAEALGGAVANSTVNGSDLLNNWSGSSGGGTYGGVANNCRVAGNISNTGGGVSYGTANNCLISSNSASFFGGGQSDCLLNNCTLTGNYALQGGGAWDGTLNNCVVYYNFCGGAADGANYSTAWSTLTMNRCCTTPAPPLGTGNITDEPGFIDLAGGNLRLQLLSPCLNAGLNSYVSGAVDLDGNPRIVGSAVDIGCYETQP